MLHFVYDVIKLADVAQNTCLEYCWYWWADPSVVIGKMSDDLCCMEAATN